VEDAGPACNVTIAYSGGVCATDDSPTFYATGSGRSPEVALKNAREAAERDPFGKWWL
jgi:hypothetical protein